MSWPADGKPRFKVASIQGTAYVLDRNNCHRILVEVQGQNTKAAERRASRFAACFEEGSDPRLLPSSVRKGTIYHHKPDAG